MSFSARILTIIIFATALFGIGQGTFAAVEQEIITNADINTETKTFSADITGSQTGMIVRFFFHEPGDTNNEYLQFFGDAPYQPANVSINLEYLTFTSPYPYFTADPEHFVDSIFVVLENEQSQAVAATQNLSIVTLTGGTGPTITFPGWQTAEYRQIASNGQYYPYVKSAGPLERDAALNLYLTLEDRTSNEITVIETYPAGSQYLNVTWPVSEPELSYLVPGHEYAVYLSDVADGSLAILAEPEETYETIGVVPFTGGNGDVVSVNQIAIKQQAGKNYYEISGVVNATVPNKMLNLTIRPVGGTTLGALLGQVPYQEGYEFVTPTPTELENFQNLPDGQYELLFNVAGLTGPEVVAGPIALPPIGGGTNGGGVTSGGSGGGIITFNDTQQDILNNGIVPTNCGYKLSDGGKICGFADVIRLIQRVIEYIFILILPLAAIVFAYAGFLFLTSGGSSDKRKAAKKAMTSVLVGIIIVMLAWLVVRTIVGSLGVDTTSDTFYLAN
ncbi:hypothetical protein KC929_01180 [Patescibacteria group bacterium]|nr:hypothetical protein [Patescibacteria group bacterium]